MRKPNKLSVASVVYWLTAIFIASIVLDGPFRYFLNKIGLINFAYVPKVLFLLALPILLIVRAKTNKGVLVGFSMVMISLIWGVDNLPSAKQALFGLWVLIPLLFGLLAARYIVSRAESYSNLFLIMFIIVVTGVFLNPILNFPWVGQALEIGGRTVVNSRQWSTFGVDRYAGFSSASYSAASQALIFAIWLVATKKSKLLNLLVWFIAGAAIALTTSKGPFGAWIVLGIFFLSNSIWRSRLIARQAWVAILSVILSLSILLPLSSLYVKYYFSGASRTTRFLLSSFGDRLSWMWPDSLRLLRHPVEWIAGRGLGGIGAPQQYFESAKFLPADNLFVYLCVDLGLPGAILVLSYPFFRISLAFLRERSMMLPFALLMAVMTYGIVVSVIEDSLLSFTLALCIATGLLIRPDPKPGEMGRGL